MRSEGYTVLGLCVCVSVCLSVSILALYTGNDAAYERYQQLYIVQQALENETSDFAKTTAFEIE